MFLREHLLEDAVTVLEVLREFALLPRVLRDLPILEVFLWWFDGSAAALAPRDHFRLLRVGQRRGRLAPAGSDGGRGGGGRVCFSLHSLFLKGERADRGCECLSSQQPT